MKMDTVAESGRNPVSKHHIQPECGECAGLRGTGRPNPSRETNSQVRTGTGKMYFSRSAGHEQNW